MRFCGNRGATVLPEASYCGSDLVSCYLLLLSSFSLMGCGETIA